LLRVLGRREGEGESLYDRHRDIGFAHQLHLGQAGFAALPLARAARRLTAQGTDARVLP